MGLVRALKPEEVAEHSVFDVLMPRPGVSVKVPEHSVGRLMCQYLSYDLEGGMADLSIEKRLPSRNFSKNFENGYDQSRSKQAESCNQDAAWEEQHGDYVNCPAKDVLPEAANEEDEQWSSDENIWLIQGDYRHFMCPTKLRWGCQEEPNESMARGKNGTCSEGKGSEHANSADVKHEVTLAFDLPRGTYATMFLRELMQKRGLQAA